MNWCRAKGTSSGCVTHQTSVTAASVFEAAALALAEFQKCTLMDAAPGPATRLSVAPEVPTVVHEVPMQKLSAGLSGGAKSPAEQAVKGAVEGVVGVRVGSVYSLPTCQLLEWRS
jgi:hypothetical protein